MDIPNKALKLIEGFEGFSSRPYWDPYGRVYTRGFGETEGITANSPSISARQGEENLKYRLKKYYAPSIEHLGVSLNENQFSALLSFVWNLGPGSMEWDVGKSLRERKYQRAANEMLEYDRAGGQVLPGLVNRRKAERNLFLTPVKQSDPFHVLYPNERKAVDKYLSWKRHPNINRIKKVKHEMEFMRSNLWDAAEYGRLRNGRRVQRGWNVNNRKARYDILRKYSV